MIANLDPLSIVAQYGLQSTRDTIIAQRCEDDLLTFVKRFWRVNDQNTPLVTGWALEAMVDHLMAVSDGQIKRLLINVPPGSCKALDDDTPILTTWGWRRHGDLRPGDFVFGPDGHPKRVLAVSDPWITDTFDVTFDDGAFINAAGDHLWSVERDVMSAAPKYRRGRKAMVVKTSELRTSDPQGSWTRRPDRIAIAAPISLPPKRLQIDPYVLGVWLGDGNSNCGSASVGHEDIEHFRLLGTIGTIYEPSGTRKQRFYRINIECLQTRLRIGGLLNNKHIPPDYLEASIEQRWRLLQGLMDTDGTATAQGNCIFTTKLPDLGNDVLSLVASLGLKPTIRETWSKLNGVRHGPYYVVAFTPSSADTPVFALARKQARVRGAMNGRSRHRYVTEVAPTSARSVRCIQVEGHIYLAGKRFVPTHNSLLSSVFFPAWEWGPVGKPWLRYICASYNGGLTMRDNGRFKRVIMDDEYRRLWGHRFEVERLGEKKVTNDKTGWKLATSVEGVGTGERGNRIIIDDANNPKDTESIKVREGVQRWITEVMMDRLNNVQDDVIIVIQQRTHALDATGTLLKLAGLDYVHLCIPNEYDPTRHCITVTKRDNDGTPLVTWEDPRGLDDNGNRLDGLVTEWVDTTLGPKERVAAVIPGSPADKAVGALFWPQRLSPEATEKMKIAKGPFAYAAQYDQLPVPRGGGIIKSDWWRLWTQDYPEFISIVASLDTAFKEGEENDYNALTVWGVFKGPKDQPLILMIHAERRRCDLPTLVKFVGDTCKERNVDYLLIEDRARGYDTARELRRQHGNRRWSTLLIDPRKDLGGDKVARLNTVVPMFSGDVMKDPNTGMTVWLGGVVYTPDKEWAQEVIDEVEAFPRGEHDDYVDTVSMALIWMRRRGLAKRQVEHEEEEVEAMTFKKPPKARYDV